ncbi:amino acid adenylation domain-containing protein, partial [Hoyosella rhizosphaerae]
SYMVPSAFVVIDEVPLTPQGKVDRRALPEPDLVGQREYVAPRTDDEATVQRIFAEVLGVEQVSVVDSFFELGGNSLMATRAVTGINEAFGAALVVREIFEFPTVEKITEAAVERAQHQSDRPSMSDIVRPENIPLSLGQQRMWFINQFDTQSAGYNIPLAVTLTGPLNVHALRDAFADLVERHEILRTYYPPTVDGAVQKILPPNEAELPLPLHVVDDATNIEQAALGFATEGFDVAVAPPIRAALWQRTEEEHLLVVVMHHICGDGSSLAPLIRDLMTAFAARLDGNTPQWEPLAMQYADFAIWQRLLLGDESNPESLSAKQVQYWREALADLPDLIELPLDRPRPTQQDMTGGNIRFSLPKSVHTRIVDIAHHHSVTPFMVIHAAFAALLSRVTPTEDIAVATPKADRADPALDDIVGMFVNTLVLRTTVPHDRTFTDLIDDVRAADIAAFGHSDIPFERLVEVLNPARSQSHAPLAQVGYSYQNLDRPELHLAGLTIAPLAVNTNVAQYDLHLHVQEETADDGSLIGLHAAFTYATALFDKATVSRLADQFVRLLEAITDDPLIEVGDIEILGPEDKQAVLSAWGQGDVFDLSEAPATLVDRFDNQVMLSKDATALVFRDELMTYAELDARANSLARHLIGLGVGPETMVGLSIRRSFDLLIGMYAIVKAGGAYVPIDPDHPTERNKYVLEASKPVCLLTTTGDAVEVPDGVDVLCLDQLEFEALSALPVTDADRRGPLRPDNTAYVMFTSGSTGRPKGVMVTHRAIVNQIAWKQSEYQLTSNDVILQKIATTFDVSVWEFWWALSVGAQLLISEPDMHQDPAYVARMIENHGVTATTFVPSPLSVFVTVATREQLSTLRDIFVIGEALPMDVIERWSRISDARVHNLYGPTEAAVSVTNFVAQSDEQATVVPIGVPQWNTGAFVLDGRLKPVPPGVPGELYLTGVQLARGYLDRPDISSDRFVASPIAGHGERMYRTGDLVRWRTNGVLEYIGRTDFQIKLRGQRIELGEIEAALLSHPIISQVVVILANHPDTGDYLAAYAVPIDGALISGEDLLAYSRDKLPRYMVPAHITVLPEFPLNPSGKLDRKALPKPDFSPVHHDVVAPRNPIEETIAAVFAEVLSSDAVSVLDGFFDIGGNSLSATRVIARVNEALNSSLAVRDIFDNPSVEALAERVEHGSTQQQRTPLTAQSRPDQVPLSLAQKRMWVINQLDPGSAAYNLPLALRLSGQLDINALTAAIRDVVARHETLRTVFPSVGDQAHQVVLPISALNLDVPLHEVDSDKVFELVGELATEGFDVATQIPIRGGIYRIDAADHVVVLVLHHIAADGFSMGPLARDIMLAYHARLNDTQPGWQPLQVQYADFTLWQHAVLGDEADPESLAAQQVGYWKHTLDGLPELLDVPTDFPRPASQSMRGSKYEYELAPELFQSLEKLARQHNATLFMVVHSALSVLLARLAGTDDIAIGTPIAGRGDRALDDIVGMFVNTLVLRTQLQSDSTFADVLAHNRETDLAAFTHADVPFERLVEALDPPRSAAHSPLFQVIVAFENLDRQEFELDGLTISGLDSGYSIAKYDLQFAFADTPTHNEKIRAAITYATDLFTESTIAIIAEQLTGLLDAVAQDPTANIYDYPLIDAQQRAALWPVGGGDGTPPQHLAELMKTAAAHNPEAPAVVFRDYTTTYRELDQRSNQLARLLLAHGARPERVVAVSIPRSVQSVEALWAVAKTGAVFLPIDPEYPRDRIEHMIADSGVELVVTTVPDHFAGRTVLDLNDTELNERITQFSGRGITEAELHAPVRVDQAAYMIYTSGSTGLPKGVVVTHRGLANYAAEQQERFGIDASSRVLHFSSPSFDASMLELLLAIPMGAAQCVVPTGIYGGDELAEFLTTNAVTHAFVATAAMGTVPVGGIDDLQCVIVGGEAVPAELVTKWAPGRTMFNAYGPTETTIVATLSTPMLPGQTVHIGGPIRGTSALVLDNRLNPTPVGVPGELYLAGMGVARGYHNRHGLTATRFVADPSGPDGAQMYRTGDIVKWSRLDDGSLVLLYVGRSDFQVKVRGFRIELGEIDSALATHPLVDSAVTLAVQGIAKNTQLVSYVKPMPGTSVGDLPVEEVRAHIAATLPDYMVPSALMPIADFPLTRNGKLDRAALPDPVFTASATQYKAPTTPMEEAVVRVIEQLLGLTDVGVEDSFFSLGGDSIMSIQLVSRAKDAGVVFTARDVFEHKTPAAIARVASWADETTAAVLPELPGGGVGQAPLLPVMHWMTELGGKFNQFSQAMLLTLPPAVDAERLRRTLDAVVDGHDALRARFWMNSDGHWQYETMPVGSGSPNLHRVEFDEEVGTPDFADRVRAEHDAAARRLNPAAGDMLQCVWFDPAGGGGATAGKLLILAHHLVVDGVSWRILLPDLANAWAQSERADSIALPPVVTSARRWAHVVNELASAPETAAELQWWLDTSTEPDPPLGSSEFHPHEHMMGQLSTCNIAVPADIADPVINDLPRLYRSGVNDAMLAALALAVARYRHRRSSTHRELLLNLEGHGREENLIPGADLSRTTGWFTNVFPARITVSETAVEAELGAREASDLLKSVKEQLVAIPRKGMGYGQLRYVNPETTGHFGSAQIPQIAFNYLGRVGGSAVADQAQQFGWLPDGSVTGANGTADDSMGAPAALNINITAVQDESGVQLRGSLSYINTLFTDADAEELVDLWTQALSELSALALHTEFATVTPSDVPLVAVDQRTLDSLVHRYRDAGLEVRDVWSLSPLQGGLLFHALLSGHERDIYVAQTVIKLGGVVDSERMRSAGQALLDRHANLRAVFLHDSAGNPAQLVLDDVRIRWQHTDLTSLPLEQARVEAKTIRQTDQFTSFRMDDAPLVRMHLVTIEDGKHELLFTNHHILLDGWSMPVLVKELLTLYATRADTAHLPSVRPYKDFLSWLAAHDRDEARAQWATTLSGLDEPSLIAPGAGEGSPETDPSEVVVEFSVEQSRSLTNVAQDLGVTLNTVVQVAWGIVLGQQLGRDDVVFGATVSGRPPQLSGVENMVGLFINTIPTRVQVHSDDTLASLAIRVQQQQAALLDHHHVSLPEIQQVAGSGALFDTLTVFESYPVDAVAGEAVDIDGMSITGLSGADDTHYPLSIIAYAQPQLTLKMKHRADLISDAQAASLAQRMRTVLEAFSGSPSVLVRSVELLSLVERELVLAGW